MITFADTFRKMSTADQDGVLAKLKEMVKWRGWLRSSWGTGPVSTVEELDDIAAIFARNGCEVEELT